MKLILLSILSIVTFFSVGNFKTEQEYRVDETKFLIHTVDPTLGKLKMYWKDDSEQIFGSILQLKKWLATKNQELVFAMNGGMYQEDQSPQGLYIENGKVIEPINRKKSDYGNFFMEPNGIFYLTKDGKAGVSTTNSFELTDQIDFATQSGPMLLIDGNIHPKFNKNSGNFHIRNGVGILPNGKVMFAMSKETVKFYDLSTLFKQNGCKNALYLDGFVSRAYLPSENWNQTGGHFGVIIGEVK